MRPADPVALHELDRLGPVEHVEIGEQPVGVRGDPQHPLLERPAVDREVAAVAPAVGGDLFVGEHGAQTRAPVHRRLGDVGEPVGIDELRAARARRCRRTAMPSGVGRAPLRSSLDELGDRPGAVRVVVVPGVVDLEEDPLRPAVVRDVGRGRAPPRVVRRGRARAAARFMFAMFCVGRDARVRARSAPRTAPRAARTRRSPSRAAR